MKSTKFASVVALSALVLGAGTLIAQQDKPKAPAAPKDAPAKPEVPATPSPEDMKMMAEMLAPAPEHKAMWKNEGAWNCEVISMFMPGQEMKSKGTATFKKVFDGLYMIGEFKGDMMGMPFKGMEIIAFNKVTKKYQSSWIDSMGTGIMNSEGAADETGKIVYTGSFDDPMSGQKMHTKQVITHINDDKFTFDMYGVQDGQEQKMMTIIYTRAVDAAKTAGGDAAPAKK